MTKGFLIVLEGFAVALVIGGGGSDSSDHGKAKTKGPK